MIRNVIPEKDAAQIADIYNYYVTHSVASFETEPLDVRQMLARINSIAPQFPYYVYEAPDGSIGAFGCVHPWKERKAYYITLETTLYVRPEFQRQGIGSIILKKLIDDSRAAGFSALIACITAVNEPSIAMHLRHGFKKVSHFEKVGCKFGRILDVVDLELLL